MTHNRTGRFLVALLLTLRCFSFSPPPSSDAKAMRSQSRSGALPGAGAKGAASAQDSATFAIAYLSQVMDQFHDRFPVYDDVSSAGNHFFVWPKFGDLVSMNGSFTGNPHSGATAIQCIFTPTPGNPFGGFVFQNGTLRGTNNTPEANFGTEPDAGINLTGATELTFWARGKQGGEVIDFFMGGVGRNSVTGNVNVPCLPNFPGPCPYPDSTRAIKITRTLTNQWQQFRIELNNVSLNYVLGGFGWGADAGAEFYLDDIQYELSPVRRAQRLEEPRFLKSFTTLPFQVQPAPVGDFDRNMRNAAFVYDNAVALLALLEDGSDESLRRAKLIGDAFVYASQHDRAYDDGRLRTAYSAGDISLPPGWTPNGRPGTVPVPGFYDEVQQTFNEIEQDAVDTGNNTWAMIALLALYRVTSNPSYLETARNLGNFIRTFRNNAGTYQGFQGGLDNPETPTFTRRIYASTEHNLDVYAAFARMSLITGESQWQSDAQHAKLFVEAMWDAQRGCYLAGTIDPATRNQVPGQLPLDVQPWSVLALPDTLLIHPQVLGCAEQNHRTTDNGFSGFDFNDDKDGVWFEGTGQMATAFAFAAQSAQVAALRQELSRAQHTVPFGDKGGIVAATRDGLTTGFDFQYFRRLHVGATAWNVFAQLGANPFYQTRAPTLQLASASHSVSESSNRVDVIVMRAGETALGATIDYATSDSAGLTNCNVVNGVASSRCDYATSVGTLRFAAGETSKTISIPVVDDAYAEGNESFAVTLSSPSGAILGTPASATITINDNETVNGTNPIDQTAFFVRQQYVDFLGREPDPPGFAAWQAIINNCPANDTTCDRIHVSSAFFRSPEFQERGYFVYRFYPVAFGRKPDYVEFIPDLAKVSGFLSDAELEAARVAFIAEFMSRPGFMTKFDGLNNTQYVDLLLSTAGVTHANRDAWIAALGAGTKTRAQVLREIVESSEVFNKYFNEAFVVMQYFGYLRRDPDALYLDWIQVLDTTGNFRTMVNGFMNSPEYRFRFGL